MKKQVWLNTKKCCISLHRLGNQYIFVFLQIKYRYCSVTGLNFDRHLDEIGDFGWTKNDILDSMFVQSLNITHPNFLRGYSFSLTVGHCFNNFVTESWIRIFILCTFQLHTVLKPPKIEHS